MSRWSDVYDAIRRVLSRRPEIPFGSRPLDDDALVVRGGLMELAGLRTAVETGYRRDGYFSLSFFGENGMSVEEIIRAARDASPGALPHKQIRLTTAGRFAHEIGRKPHREGEVPHLEVRFETNPTDEELLEIEGILTLP